MFLHAKEKCGQIGGGVGITAIAFLQHHGKGRFVGGEIAGQKDAERPAGIGGERLGDALRFRGFGDAVIGVLGVGEIVFEVGNLMADGFVLGIGRGAGVAGGQAAFAADFQRALDVVDNFRQPRAIETLAALVFVAQGDAEHPVNFGVMAMRFDAHAVPQFHRLGFAGLQFHHGFARRFPQSRIFFELLGRRFVIAVEVFDRQGFLGEAILPHVVDDHAELSAEVADVVLADHGVAEKFQDAGHGVAEDGGAQMADVHLLGDVWAGVIDDDGAGPIGPLNGAGSTPARSPVNASERARARKSFRRRRLMKPGPEMVGTSQMSSSLTLERIRAATSLGGRPTRLPRGMATLH